MAVPIRHKVYQTIRSRLLNGHLPPGSRVSESAIAEELRISRGPVREAINRLVSEGLLRHVPNWGAFVHKPERFDLEDVYQFREMLEGEVAAEAARRITDAQLARLQQACRDMLAVARDYRDSGCRLMDGALHQRHVEADLAFHVTLAAATGNRHIMKVLGDQHVISRVWGLISQQNDLRDLVRLYRDHCRIVHAVGRKDAACARQAMRAHIRSARWWALEKYDWQQRQQSLENSEFDSH